MTICAICLLISTSLGRGASLTIEIPATRVSEAIKVLAKSTCKAMRCAAELRNEVVMLSSKDETEEQILAKFATVLGAKWNNHGDVLVLEIDKAIREEDVKREQLARIKALDLSIGEAISRLPSREKTVEASLGSLRSILMDLAGTRAAMIAHKNNDFYAVVPSLPVNYLITRAAAAIGSKELAAIPRRRVVIFSNLARGIERQAKGSLRVAISEYSDTQADLYRRLKKSPDSEALLRIANITSGLAANETPKIVVICSNMGPSVWISGGVFSSSGELLGFYTFTLKAEIPSQAPLCKPLLRKDIPIAVNPICKPYLQFLEMNKQVVEDDIATDECLSGELTGLLSHPEENDPLLPLGGPLHSLSEIDGPKSTCALLDDSLLPRLSIYLNSGIPQNSDTFTRFLSEAGTSCSFDGSWLLVRPDDRNRILRERLDRASLGSLLRSTIETKGVSLEKIADYVFSTGPEATGQPLDLYCRRLLPFIGANPGYRPNISDSFLRFYGSLAPTMRQRLRGDGLRGSDLLPNQWFWLEQWLTRSLLSGQRQEGAIEPSDLSLLAAEYERPALIAQTKMILSESAEEAILSRKRGDAVGSWEAYPNSAERISAMLSDADMLAAPERYFPAKYEMGLLPHYDFEVLVNGRVKHRAGFRESFRPLRTALVKWSELPKSFRDRATKRTETGNDTRGEPPR